MNAKSLRQLRGGVGLSALLVITACNDELSPSNRPIQRRLSAHAVSASVSDSTMGEFSPIARHLAAALRDSSIRRQLASSMHATTGTILGIDLQACNVKGIVKVLLEEGEHRGVGSAAAACAVLNSRKGAVLYMDPDRLRAWDGSAVPIVTAVAQPGRQLPRSFSGYVSADTVTDLPADGSLKGPILVLLPYTHPHRVSVRSSVVARSRVVDVKSDTIGQLQSIPATPPTE